MANELYTRTNQKIYFSGLALERLRKAEAGEGTPGQAEAEREAVLFHLYGGLLGLCHEVAGYYRMPQARAPRVEALVNQAVIAESPSPELAELVEIAGQPESWLARLLGAYAALFLPPSEVKEAKADIIRTWDVDAQPAPLSHALLEEWRQNIKGLALRFRESLSEC
ncbi:DUF6586 family protein [Pseudomonas sp. LRF_L74]|uniref:DUF6586 family protein n=1 Tax=Pseudomonas sp. LRF_L74 TaxID=3369422 RepID=UPI003F5FF85E